MHGIFIDNPDLAYHSKELAVFFIEDKDIEIYGEKDFLKYSKIKVDYSDNIKYPTIYTLDGEWMFEPTVFQSKILMDFEVIPKCIVVGIFHKNRNEDLGIDWKTGEFERSGLTFYDFLNKELIPKINAKYSTSGFNGLVGHSNSATFCAKVLTQKGQPFKGFIALSQNLFGNQFQEYAELTKQKINHPLFYLVASGKRDATPRLKSGMKLDSLFKLNSSHNLRQQHALYDADHTGIVGKGLNSGISHIFSTYRHFNDCNEKLIDSLVANNISGLTFLEDHTNKMKHIYGIDFKINRNDLTLIQAMAQSDSDIQDIQDFEIKNFGKTKEFYATYAQYYEYTKSYDKALEYWTIHLEKYHKEVASFFYYRRPIDLLHKKMKQPEKAIEFAEKWNEKAPRFAPEFNLKIANIASENGIKSKKGLKAIREYIKSY